MSDDTVMDMRATSELFELRVVGALAAAFHISGIVPTDEQWEILRGTRECTLRDMAEVGFDTGFQFDIGLSAVNTPEEIQ